MDKPIVWKAELDHTWDIKVYRTDDSYKGTLVMKNKETNQTVLNEEVSLSFGAMFGPDVSDVAVWQGKCLQVADEQIQTV